jgi:DNA-binding transcriptional MerR regulator
LRIKEIEKLTGITSKNIRFYEKQGLLNPSRNVENLYRQYSVEDLRRLKEIKLLRKIGISISDINDIQNGFLTIAECFEKYLSLFVQQKKELEKRIELCAKIHKNEARLQTMDVDCYLDEINNAELHGAKFINIAKDFINKVKENIPAHYKMFFEPSEPITNQFEFVSELEKYADENGMALTIVKMGMCPTVLLEGKRYIGGLETPRMLNFPFSMFYSYAAVYNYGYRWVYLYDDDIQTW